MQCARAATVQSMAVKLLIRNSELQYLITGAPLRLRQNYCSGAASISSGAANVKELSATTTLLRDLRTGAEIYLVGSAHVSQQSAEEVREMIRLVKPQTVMLELCEERLQKLRNATQGSPGFLQAIMSQLGMPGGLQAKLVGASLSGLYAGLRSLGLDPGAEFKAGIEEAERLGARIVCGDQSQRVIAQNLAKHLQLSDLLWMFTGGSDMPPELQKVMETFPGDLKGAIEALKTRQSARLMREAIRKMNPGVAAALIDDRDQTLVNSLKPLRGKVVAVVGLAHLDGIQRLFFEDMAG